MRRGKGGKGLESDADEEAFPDDTATLRCSHCGEVAWRVRSFSSGNASRGKGRRRFAKTEGSSESMQVFAVGETRRRASLDDRERRERRRVIGKVGE